MTNPKDSSLVDAAIAANPHAALCFAAELVIADGVAHARVDDPHRFLTLAREFDDGKALRRLVVDYLAGGQVRISTQLHGTERGEPKVVELFSTLIQGPADAGVAH
jgi:hypothetical protein